MHAYVMRSLVVLAVLLAAAAPAAHAELARVGPVTAGTAGYPAWYQDTTGLALEFCQPQNQAELDGGWCLLLPGDTTVPESLPATFADEHFYWAADAGIEFPVTGGTSRARLILGLEAAFAQGPVVEGDQVVFGRVRINIRALPFTGDYTIRHPFGTRVVAGVAGERMFVTEDIGFNCASGEFHCALASSVGPFLLPSDTPGGPELPAISGPVPGKLYIADPARLGPVTGSPVGQNFFRVEGPNGFVIETSNFTLMGRLHTAVIPGKVQVERASYERSLAGIKLDVFATAFPTSQGRLPGSPKPPEITPVLAYYPAACTQDAATGALGEPAGLPAVQMFNAGSSFWGQSQPAALPDAVCVEDYTSRDVTGQVVPAFFQAPVTDDVTITEALYDPSNARLSVKATSSDQLVPPTLTLERPNGVLAAGQIVVNGLAAPPGSVRVASSAGGLGELRVKTGIGSAPTTSTLPVAGNDTVTLAEDSGTTNIAVLANDSLSGAPIVTGPGVVVAIVVAPQLGTATINADNSIGFTPSANANGTDGIGYTVSVNGSTSATAYVTINITPVNDPPTAVNDAASGVVDVPITINVLANDTDPDGQADLARADIVTPPVGATAAAGAGGAVTFTASAGGTYTFTYRAQDTAGASSAGAATVTVTVAGSELISITTAEYRRDQSRFRAAGSDSVRAGQTLTITYANGADTTTPIGTAVVDGAGAWALDLRGVALPAGATQIRVTSPLGATATATLRIR